MFDIKENMLLLPTNFCFVYFTFLFYCFSAHLSSSVTIISYLLFVYFVYRLYPDFRWKFCCKPLHYWLTKILTLNLLSLQVFVVLSYVLLRFLEFTETHGFPQTEPRTLYNTQHSLYYSQFIVLEISPLVALLDFASYVALEVALPLTISFSL